MECQYCKNIFSTKTSYNTHQKTAKYCLKLREDYDQLNEHICIGCDKKFTKKCNLDRHIEGCKMITKVSELNKDKLLLVKDVENYKQQVEQLQKQIIVLQDKLENIATAAVSRPFEEHNSVDIVEEDDSNDDEDKEEYVLKDLEVSKGYTISHREEDGYINVTQLCAAGKKKFAGWYRLEKTKAFLQVLSMSVGIHTNLLIKSKTDGPNEDRATWVHPQVAINIAQWISPHFDVKVSAWVYEAMMTGKVDISNTTSYRELQKEVKDKNIKINLLTKKYVKKQPRLEIPERNVIYILTTKLLRKDRRYILGKATNLTSRLSTYNKTDEHEIVYYQGCEDEDIMSTVENLIFSKLKNYREQANRERFILPLGEDISLFVNTIKECIKFIS